MKRFAIFVGALAAALVVWLLATGRNGAPDKEPSPGVSVFAEAAWPMGRARTYRVDFRMKSAVTLRSGETSNLGAGMAIEGDLKLRSHGLEGGQIVLSAEWTEVRSASMEAFERQLSPQIATELVAARAVLHLDADGHLGAMGIVPGATPLSRHMVRALLTEIAATAETRWGTRDIIDTSLGQARVVRGEDRWQRTGYVLVDALGAPTESNVTSTVAGALDGGMFTRLASDETMSASATSGPVALVAGEVHLGMEAKGAAAQEGSAPPPETRPESIRPLASNADQRAASLEQRSKGVSAESVFDDVRQVALFPKSQETAWLWRDSAWLELNPNESARLIERAERELGLMGTAAAFDAVVTAGTEEGQRALLASLERHRDRSDPQPFFHLVQHVGHLRDPAPELFAFVALTYATAEGDRRLACAYTLGAMARRSLELRPPDTIPAREGRPFRYVPAEDVLTTLEHDLGKAKTNEEREMLIRALGNGGQTRSFSSVAPHAESADADIREAVASSLRNMEGGPVVDTLIKLTADTDGSVATAAIESLFRKSLDESDWRSLESIVTSDTLASDARLPLVNKLAPLRSEIPTALTMLRIIRDSVRTHPKLRMQVESLLDG